MNAKKITAIVLLTLFVLSFPLTLAITNLGSILFNQNKVTDLVVTDLVSDKALPGLIKEITILETEHGALNKLFDNRMLMNVLSGIQSNEWVELFDIVLPEKDRVALVDNIVGGLFTWFNDSQPYPDITIQVSPIIARLENNLPDVAAWIFKTFHVPACDAKQIARYQASDFGTDPQALITCTPPEDLKENVIAGTATAIQTTLTKQAPPAVINLTQELSKQMPHEQMLAQKAKLNQVRTLSQFLWIVPVLFFLIAIALVVRSLKEIITWVQWPFLVVGGLGSYLALRIGNPTPLITDALLPPPEAVVPPPAVAVLLRIANGLLSQVSVSMLWECLPFFIVGVILLAYSYRETLKAVPAGLVSFLRSLTPPNAEEKA